MLLKMDDVVKKDNQTKFAFWRVSRDSALSLKGVKIIEVENGFRLAGVELA